MGGKLTCKTQFKKRATRAVREIKKYAGKVMNTTDIRIDPALNRFVWSRGIRNVPTRVRVRMSRKRSDGEDAAQPFYTLVQHLDIGDRDAFKELLPRRRPGGPGISTLSPKSSISSRLR